MRLRSRHNNLTLNNIVNRQTGKVVFFGDSNWNLVLNMMIGIQTAVKSSLMTYQFELNIVDDCDKKYYFELIPRRFGAQNSTKICKFVDYAPLTFKRIRQHFGINETMYLKSLGPDRLLASIVLGEISSMTSMISQGKSGAVFYTSSDGQYMLKSIPKHEF
jgi:1-phosphatidylinositol-4-phosphate 5-kinase